MLLQSPFYRWGNLLSEMLGCESKQPCSPVHIQLLHRTTVHTENQSSHNSLFFLQKHIASWRWDAYLWWMLKYFQAMLVEWKYSRLIFEGIYLTFHSSLSLANLTFHQVLVTQDRLMISFPHEFLSFSLFQLSSCGNLGLEQEHQIWICSWTVLNSLEESVRYKQTSNNDTVKKSQAMLCLTNWSQSL